MMRGVLVTAVLAEKIFNNAVVLNVHAIPYTVHALAGKCLIVWVETVTGLIEIAEDVIAVTVILETVIQIK